MRSCISFSYNNYLLLILDCPYENLKNNGYCNGKANIKECDFDGGDCCLKEACKLKTIKRCTDGKDCTATTTMNTCTDISGVDDTCECIDPSVRTFTFQSFESFFYLDYHLYQLTVLYLTCSKTISLTFKSS